LVNTMKLESISSAGSIGFLIIFAVVNLVGVRCASKMGSSRFIPAIGALGCLAALAALLLHSFESSKADLLIASGIIAACFAGEFIYKSTERASASS